MYLVEIIYLGDQDNVTVLEEEVLEAETKTENDFNSNIRTAHLNSDNETISDSSKSERFIINI